jgi:hypothetical protein
LTCSYNNQEFFRVGYYVNNQYDNEEMNLNPPEQVDIEKVERTILSDKPRITKFNIDWDSTENVIPSYNNYMFNDNNGSKLQDLFKNADDSNSGKTLEEEQRKLFNNINNNIKN